MLKDFRFDKDLCLLNVKLCIALGIIHKLTSKKLKILKFMLNNSLQEIKRFTHQIDEIEISMNFHSP